MEIQICPKCKKRFKAFVSRRRKYCSLQCKYLSLTKKTIKKCIYCKRKFCKRVNGKFCSARCFYQYRSDSQKLQVGCLNCKIEFSINPYRYRKRGAKFCSHKCFSEYNSGENNWQWKGGILTDDTRKRKMGKQYQDWRRLVLIRDDYTCQKCKYKHTNIVVHHIKSYKEYPKLRLDLYNALTLCENCHNETHKNINRKRKEGVNIPDAIESRIRTQVKQ